MNSQPAFLDSSAIYVLANRNDSDHRAVAAAYRGQSRLITHSVILLEAFSLISKKLGKHVAIEVVEKFRLSPKIEKVFVDDHLIESAWQRCA